VRVPADAQRLYEHAGIEVERPCVQPVGDHVVVALAGSDVLPVWPLMNTKIAERAFWPDGCDQAPGTGRAPE